MSATLVGNPFTPILDLRGVGLNDGAVYVGAENMDPRTNPQDTFWDEALTIPASQPLDVIGGYIYYLGSPARPYVDGPYSIAADTAQGVQVFYEPSQGSTPTTSTDVFDDLSDLIAATVDPALLNVTVNRFSADSHLVPSTWEEVTNIGTVLPWQVRSNGNTRRWQLVVAGTLNAWQLGVVGNGTTNNAQALQNCAAYIKAGLASAWYTPAGRYVCNDAVVIEPGVYQDDYLGDGFRFYGDGPLRTIFLNGVVNGALFTLKTGASVKFLFGQSMENFGILPSGAPASSTGIRIESSFAPALRHLYVYGMSLDGVRVICAAGDTDASNSVLFDQCWFVACSRWGINAKADSGFNETSFVRLMQTRLDACGVASASTPPPSGGMIWKGQVLTCDQASFVTNENVGLYIPGEAGLANTVGLRETTFENNRQRHFYCTGLNGFVGENLQFYSSDVNQTDVMCEFDGSATLVKSVRITGAVVRATSGNNPITAFKISGGMADLTSCRVDAVTWQNFDYAGQTRFDGWLFDPIPTQATLVTETTGILSLKGWNGQGGIIPLRLRGINAGSTTGEWVAYNCGAGVFVFNAGLTPSTTYYAYLYDNANVPAIELSTTGSAIDTATGYSVKTGDATRTFIGGVITDAGGLFITTGNGWFLPTRISGSQVAAYKWVDAAGKERIKTTAPTSDTDGTIVGTQS